ncbi:MAG: hypothetical protein AAF198_02305 [Pseudomonadota bacterium]
MWFFIVMPLIGAALGWGTAYFKKRNFYDQLHSAAVMGLIFVLLSVLYVVIVGWIAIGQT